MTSSTREAISSVVTRSNGSRTSAVPTFECPTCRKTLTVSKNEDAPYRPFCCDRCKMIDLGKWFDGTYKISDPAKPEDLPETESDSG